MKIKEHLAQSEQKHKGLVEQIQSIQTQQQQLEQQRQQLIAEMLRVEGELGILRRLDGEEEEE